MKYTYFHLMTKLCSLLHPCSIGKKLIQNLCHGLGIIHLATVCWGWRRPSTWSRQGEGHQRSYRLVRIVELATYLFTYWPTFCKMSRGSVRLGYIAAALYCSEPMNVIPGEGASVGSGSPWPPLLQLEALGETSTHVNTMVKIPKIHLDYFLILQISHVCTKSGSLSLNVTSF